MVFHSGNNASIYNESYSGIVHYIWFKIREPTSQGISQMPILSDSSSRNKTKWIKTGSLTELGQVSIIVLLDQRVSLVISVKTGLPSQPGYSGQDKVTRIKFQARSIGDLGSSFRSGHRVARSPTAGSRKVARFKLWLGMCWLFLKTLEF